MSRFPIRRSSSATFLAAIVLVAAISCRPEVSYGQFDDPFTPTMSSTERSRPPAENPIGVAPVNDAIRQALAKRISVHINQTPLEDVVESLEKTCQVPVFLDRKSLDGAATATDSPVSLDVSDMSLACVLAHMLRPLDLAYVPRGDVLVITTPEEAEEVTVTQLHPVGDLVRFEVGRGDFDCDFDSLIDLITTIVQPTSWDCCGGPLPIWPVRVGSVDALAFQQMPEVHDQTARLLSGMRTILRRRTEGETAASVVMDLQSPDPSAYESIHKVLGRKISLSCDKTPLAEVVAKLREAAGTNVLLDERAAGDIGIAPNAPVSIDVADVPLASALSRIVDERKLAYDIWNEAIVVTTPEEAETRSVVGIYDVTDLVRNDDSSRWPWAESSTELLEEVIQRRVQPRGWAVNSGPGSMLPFEGQDASLLVVSQKGPVHEEIRRLLAQLRGVAKKAKGRETADVVSLLKALFNEQQPVTPAPPGLSDRVTLDFQDATLEEIARFISTTCSVKCRVSESLLQGNDAAPPAITFHLHGATLETALTLLAEQLGLAWDVRDGGIWIGEPQEEVKVRLEIYPVGDLVTCRDERDEIWHDFGTLENAIIQNTQITGQPGWSRFGGPCAIAGGTFAGVPMLLIWQTDRSQQQIAAFLAACRKLSAATGSSDGRPPLRRRHVSPTWGGRGGIGMF